SNLRRRGREIPPRRGRRRDDHLGPSASRGGLCGSLARRADVLAAGAGIRFAESHARDHEPAEGAGPASLRTRELYQDPAGIPPQLEPPAFRFMHILTRCPLECGGKVRFPQNSQRVRGSSDRALAFKSLAVALTEPLRTDVLQLSLTTAEKIDEHEHWTKAHILRSLAGSLPERLLERALIIAEGIGNKAAKAEALGSVPSGDHSPGDLALSPVHAQPARRRRFVGRTWSGCLLLVGVGGPHHGRANPRQGGRVETEGHLDGWSGSARLSRRKPRPPRCRRRSRIRPRSLSPLSRSWQRGAPQDRSRRRERSLADPGERGQPYGLASGPLPPSTCRKSFLRALQQQDERGHAQALASTCESRPSRDDFSRHRRLVGRRPRAVAKASAAGGRRRVAGGGSQSPTGVQGSVRRLGEAAYGCFRRSGHDLRLPSEANVSPTPIFGETRRRRLVLGL